MATQWATRESKRTSFISNVEETVTALSSWGFPKLTRLVFPVAPSHEPSSILPLTPSDENRDNVVTKDPSQCSPHPSRSSFLDESGSPIPNPAPAVSRDAQNPATLYAPINESQNNSLDVAPSIQLPVSAPVQAAAANVDPQDREVGQVHTIVNPGLALSSVVSVTAVARSQNDVSDLCSTKDVETACQVTCNFESWASRSSTCTHTQPADYDLVIRQYIPDMAEPISRDKFILPHAEISPSLAVQWEMIQTKLDIDLKLITSKLGLRFDQIITSAQFAVVGPKVGSQIHGIPTVVITCGSKVCKKLVKKALLKGQFQCLKDLRYPVLVRYKAPPARWYATQSLQPSAVKKYFSLQQRALFIELLHPPNMACSRRLKFQDETDGEQVTKFSTIGGIINIDGEIYGLTSAHTIFASLGNQHPVDRDDYELGDNSIDISEEESVRDDASDEDINQEISNVSSRVLDPSKPGNDIFQDSKADWSTLEWDGACSFAGWGGTFSSSRPAGFEMHSQDSSADWAIFRISDAATKNEPNMYYIYDRIRERYKRTEISPIIMSNHQLTPGPVWIVTDNKAPASPGTLTQTAISLYFNGASLHVRQIITRCRLGPGVSGSWVVRGPSLCGYIVAGDSHANLALMVAIEDCFVDLKSVLGAQSVLVHDGRIGYPTHSLNAGSDSSDDRPNPRKPGQLFAKTAGPPHWSENASTSSHTKVLRNFKPDTDTTSLAIEPQAVQASSSTTTVIPSRDGRRNSEDDVFEFGRLLRKDSGIKTDKENFKIDLSNHAKIGYQLNKDPEKPGDRNVVKFDGPNDPYNPKNWTSRERWATVYVISAFVFISSFASSMVAPCLNPISAEFHMNPTSAETQIVLSVFVLAYAIGPVFFGPLSEVYGRVVVLQATNIIFLVFNLACGFATNQAEIIAFRFLAGLGGSAPLAIGGAILGDLFKPGERGLAMSIYATGSLLGPFIGPIVGGFVAQYSNWRWLFRATSIVDAAIVIVSLFYLRESYTPLLLYRKCKLMRKKTDNPNLHTEFPDMDQPVFKKLRDAIIRTFSLLFSQPIIQVLGIYMAFVYGCLYLVLSTFPTLWELHYNESPGIGGLNYISIGLGYYLGAPIIGKTNDKVYHKLKARDPHGQGKPEFRMPLMIPLSFLVSIGILLYGWAAEAHLPWIMPNIGAFIFGMGTIAAFQCVTTYLVDSYTRFAASAIGSVTVLRSLTGFVFPLFAPTMYKALGYGWGNSVLGLAAICLGPPVLVLLWLFGEKLRRRSKFAVGSKPEI